MTQRPHADDDLRLALDAAREAGEAALRFFRGDAPVEWKSADQPVTEADRTADRILHRRLVGERPGYGWLSEETADTPDRLGRERVWIVDPIDGTNSFVEGIDEFAVCIALAEHGEPLLGVVYNPASGALYHARRGAGAFLDGRRIAVAADGSTRVLLASRSEMARGEFDGLGGGWRLHPLGSTAYKMARVADGTGTAYLSRGPKSEWDVAAAGLLVEEAGGRVTDLSGAPLRLNQPKPFLRGLVAAPESAHRDLLQRLAALHGAARD